jgi:hypothetical protein
VKRSLLFVILLSACAHSRGPDADVNDIAQPLLKSCAAAPELQKHASARLRALAEEDQKDREVPVDKIDWDQVTPRDIQRRIEVAEFFARGCLESAQDFASAAIVYQHGDTADQAYQASLWAKRAVELGDASQKWLAAAAIDRYLVRLHRKQLYATQFSRNEGEQCWCMDPVEETFPDKLRKQMTGKTLRESKQGFLKSRDSNCSEVKICPREVKNTPAGSVVGYW